MRIKSSITVVILSLIGVVPLAYADSWYQDPSYSFETLYFGALAGGTQLDSTIHVISPNNVASPTLDDSTSFDHSQFNGGVNLGYSASWKRWYFGVEASSQPFPISASKDWVGAKGHTYNNDVSINDYFNIDVLPGFYLTHNFIIYLRGGLAVSQVNLEQNNFNGQNYDLDDINYGAHLGGGFDLAVTNHFSVGADYIYTDYDNSSFNVVDPVTKIPSTFRVRAHSNFVGLHVRYNLLFGGNNFQA